MASPGFEISLINISDIIEEKLFNYTNDDSVKEFKLQTLINKYGQIDLVKVIPCEDKYKILCGKRIYRACKLLGLKEVVCLIIPSLTVKDELILSLALNELNFEPNYVELSKEIFKILSHKDLIDLEQLLPYDVETMDKLEQIAKFDWTKLNPAEQAQYKLFGDE